MKVKIQYRDWTKGGREAYLDSSWKDLAAAHIEQQRGLEGGIKAMKNMLGGMLELLVEKGVIKTHEDVYTALGHYYLPDDYIIEE